MSPGVLREARRQHFTQCLAGSARYRFCKQSTNLEVPQEAFPVMQVTWVACQALRTSLNPWRPCNGVSPVWHLNIQSLLSNQQEMLLRCAIIHFLAEMCNIYVIYMQYICGVYVVHMWYVVYMQHTCDMHAIYK